MSALRVPFIVLLQTFLFIPLLSALETDISFQEQGQQVDHFLARTMKRISDAWLLCRYEFQEASREAAREASGYVRETVRTHTAAAVEAVKAQAVPAAEEALRSQWEKARETAQEAVTEAVGGTKEKASEKAEEIRQSVSPVE